MIDCRKIERLILSSIYFNNDLIEDIIKYNDSFFSLYEHKVLFNIYKEVNAEDLPVEEHFITKKINQLDKNKNLIENLFLDIQSSDDIVTDIKFYLKELEFEKGKRDIEDLLITLKNIKSDNSIENSTQLSLALSRAYNDTVNEISPDKITTGKELSTKVLSLIEKNKLSDDKIKGEKSGIAQLDLKLGGFEDDRFYIIAGRPAMGKSGLVNKLVKTKIEENKGVLVYSLEMSSTQLGVRLSSAMSKLDSNKVKDGNLNDNEWKRLLSSFEKIDDSKLFIDDLAEHTIETIKATSKKLCNKKENNIRMIVIDYLQLMEGSKKYSKDRQEEVAKISRGLKLLAKELQLPIIALSQLNRDLEKRTDKRPMLSDLRESGALEQDADGILFIYRDSVYKEREEKNKEIEASREGKIYHSTYIPKNEDDAEIIIAKNRDGEIGTVECTFIKNQTIFEDKKNDSVIEIVYESSELPSVL